MAPDIQQCWRFTVVDIRIIEAFGVGSTRDAPWIQSADRPNAVLSTRQWQDLQTAVLENHTFDYKLFKFCMLMAAILPAFAFSLVTNKYYGGPTLVAGLVLLAALMLHYILTAALFGAWRCGTVRDAVHCLQPQFRQEGVELEFTAHGKLFFVIGVLSVTRSQYEPKSGNDLAVDREEGEIC